MLASASSSSSSPTISGQSPSFKSRENFRSPRPSVGSSRPSTSSSRPARPSTSHPTPPTAAKTNIQTASTAPVPAPQKATADAGTQYTPPDWPPTDPRSSRYIHPPTTTSVITATTRQPHISIPGHVPADPQPAIAAPQSSNQSSAVTSPKPGLQPPSEPQVRITPQSSLQAQTTRRRSSDSLVTANSKRARPSSDDARKVLPADYTKCEPKILASLIASMLMRLISHNDSIPLQDGQLTRFHSRAPPGISVADYMQRLTFHATLVPPILLSMVYFIDQLSRSFREFIINSLTVHRFLITAATVASKGLSDSFWTNSTYARVGGVSLKELALLEMELLMKCDWQIVPKQEMLVEYYQKLVEGSEEYVLEGSEELMDSDDDDGNDDLKVAEDEMDTSGSNG